MKRILALVLVLMMLVPAVGLAEFNPTGYPIVDEVITITMAGQNANTIDWNDTLQLAEFEKRLGIKIVSQQFESDAWKTQFTLMLASEELPDLVVNPALSLAEANDYGMQGYFLDLTEYIDQYGENIKEYEERYPLYRAYNTAPDGAIYTLNQINPNLVGQFSRVWLNKTWMDRLNLEYPETIDDLTNILRAFKEQDANGNGDPNDEIPMSHTGSYNMLANLMTAYGIQSYGSGNSYLLQADENGQVFLADTTDNYRAFLSWMSQLFADQLLDINNFVQDDEFGAKAANDKVGCYGTSAPFVAANTDISYDANFYWLGGLTSEWNDTPTIVQSNAIATNPRVLVNAETEYPAEIVRFLDYLFTDEGNLCGSYGFDGVTFDMVPMPIEGLESFSVCQMYVPEGFSSGEEFRYKKAICNEVFNIVKAWLGTQYPAMVEANEEQLEKMLPEYGWAIRLVQKGVNRCEIVPTFPGLIYNEDETAKRTELFTDISLYLSNMQAQFITGQVDVNSDAAWNEYLAQLKAMGLDDLLAIEQAAYTRLLGA